MDDANEINNYFQKNNMNWQAKYKEQNKFELKPLENQIKYLKRNNNLYFTILSSGDRYFALSGIIANNYPHPAFAEITDGLKALGFEYQGALGAQVSKFAKIVPKREFKKTIDGIEKILQ